MNIIKTSGITREDLQRMVKHYKSLWEASTSNAHYAKDEAKKKQSKASAEHCHRVMVWLEHEATI